MTSKKQKSYKWKLWSIILLLPVTITVYVLLIVSWQELRKIPAVQEWATSIQKSTTKIDVPGEYIPIYKDAADEYGIPWTLLAAHHRIETKFSTMDPLLSPVGAEGHMQFMPCTFVGWSHPSCGGLGLGEIPEEDKINPAVIAQYGGYGIDANGDGYADPFDLEDAIYSAANYLAASGAADGEIEKAIFNYNRSNKYVEDVLHFYHLYEKQLATLQTATVQDGL
ncbi:lytic transglycosylase domain-containing protein [Psychrobacillus sp. AK 1817]|uniref:Lytic transglycosylase domain-containing protein n=1 Tax=Psychrobacillus faecigallinarum TaxID=2762235 RepID=A0ABR8R9F9_9BACI|nr:MULTISPECIES: lytic transglycosylase domain-containing protein [Psychrobacillus]MBD7944433.1 lytic transglycosylase domain-containing protein [Psychrobacillus faecigallinarum]QEY19656.1 lytic transglycosylase domain-containing protein [Psychrobacillus sp. AK 1817]